MFARLQNPLHAVRLALMLVLLAALGTAAAPGFALPATSTILRVSGPVEPVLMGQSFTASIEVEGTSNLGSFEWHFLFDPAVVAAGDTGLQLDSFLGSTGRNTGELHRDPSPPQPGHLIFGAYSYGHDAGPDGNGILATITLTATMPGSSSLALEEVQVTDIYGSLLPTTVQPGSVTVVASPPVFRLYLPTLLR